MAEQSKPSMFPDYEMVCNLCLWTMVILSAPVEMLLHFKVGERYLGARGPLALLLMSTYCAFFPIQQDGLLSFLMLVFFIRTIIHRLFCIHRRMRGGEPRHSRSPGIPILGLLARRVPENWILWFEPILIIGTGLLLQQYNRPFGTYLLWSGVALIGIMMVRANLSYNRLLDALDAGIDQRLMGEAIRVRQPQR